MLISADTCTQLPSSAVQWDKTGGVRYTMAGMEIHLTASTVPLDEAEAHCVPKCGACNVQQQVERARENDAIVERLYSIREAVTSLMQCIFRRAKGLADIQ